jgi:hypothetical protein
MLRNFSFAGPSGTARFRAIRSRLTAVGLGLILTGCSPEGRGPISFQSPADWKVEWKKRGPVDSYALTTPAAGQGLLMFTRWPPPNRPEEIPSLVEKLADQFRRQATVSSDVQLASDEYNIVPFSGAHCRGNYATFRINSGPADILQAMFLMDIDGQMWSGQFTGSTESWTQALCVLKSIQRIR